jgi:hypothetical protein
MTTPTNPIAAQVFDAAGARVLESAAAASKRKAFIRWLAFSVLAALFVALAVNVAACFLPENPYQRWKVPDFDYGRMRWIYERIHYDPKPIDVVILGTSRSQVGISSTTLEQQLSERGKHENVVNFSVFNLGRNLHWLILNEIYKAKSPKVVVLEVDEPPYPFGHVLFKDLAPAEAIVSAPKSAPRQYFGDLASIPARKLKLFFANLFPGLFGLSRQFDTDAYERNRTDYTSNFPSETGGLVDMNKIVSRETLLDQLSQEAFQNAFYVREYARLHGGGDQVYLQKMVDEAKAHGTRVLFLYVPTFNGAKTVSDPEFLKQYGQIVSTGEIASRDELFQNWAHLNHAGAMAVTRRLADAIGDLSLDQSPQPAQ